MCVGDRLSLGTVIIEPWQAVLERPAASAPKQAKLLTWKAALSELVKSPMLKPDTMNDAHQPMFKHTCRVSDTLANTSM